MPLDYSNKSFEEKGATCSMSMHPIYRSICNYPEKIAVIDDDGRYTYKSVFSASIYLANQLLKTSLSGNLCGERIAFLCNSDVHYVIVQWSCWLNESICVPLCQDHPGNVLEYYIEDSKASILVSTKNFEAILRPIAEKCQLPLIIIVSEDLKIRMDEKDLCVDKLDIFSTSTNDALIIYTSGTTGRPKGVVHTIQTLKSQMDAMIKAWQWKVDDCIVNFLPLHHIHGIVNCVMTPLYHGCTLIMEKKFNVEQTWDLLLNHSNPFVTVFMAVPTIYRKMIDAYKNVDWKLDEIIQIRERCTKQMRLFVSGSAALPENIFEQWKALTGFEILEQYGMSEAGRILSNTINGKKLTGRVGLPMPETTIRLVQKSDDEKERTIIEATFDQVKILEDNEKDEENLSGELFVKGPTLFRSYFNREEITKKSFNEEKFFGTGDIVEYDQINNTFKVLGRKSVDIIKSGGYKISALDVERVLLFHPDINECVVIGVPDPTWGECVTAVIVPNKQSKLKLKLEDIRNYCKKDLPTYCCPTKMIIVETLERNAVGKINKVELRQKLFPLNFC